MKRVFLTGAASLVGAEVLSRLLRRNDVDSIGLLLSANDEVRTKDLQRLEAFTGPLPAAVSVVTGDMRLPRFGLSWRTWDALAASIDIGIHCGQREVTDQNLDLARQANVIPVEHWIQLLERNPSLQLHHLSTGFTGGTRRGLFTEFDLDCGQRFHNAYERSKFEAEVRLRGSNAADRVAIYRPSHVLGSAAKGEAFEFGGAYPLLSTMAVASILPGDAKAHIDFVPSDYVASAIVALALTNAAGTFHLASGWESSLPVRQAAELVAKARGRARGARLLPQAVAWPLRIAGTSSADGLTSRGLAFTTARDLLHQGPVLDTYLADRALKPLGIWRPAPAQWLPAVVDYAESFAWKSRASTELERPPVQTAELHERKSHRIGDVDVAFRDIGEGEPVVLLHGFAGAGAWDGVMERISAARRALVIETSSAEDTPSAEAARVRGLLSALGISSAHIVGNDTGGLIAGVFAARWPQCTKSLVLSNCNPEASWTRSRHFPRSVDPTELNTISQLLTQLEVPSMIIWGADNAHLSPSYARTLYDTMPGVRRLELIPFAGVSCHAERPDLFARHLVEFFEELTGNLP